MIYSGDASIEGAPLQAGLSVVACLDGCSNWESEPVESRYGRYVAITIGPPSTSDVGKYITFHVITEYGRITADETVMYVPGLPIARLFDISFGEPLPAPPPTPTLKPTSTPTITPTPSPTPVLPIPGDQMVTRLPGIAVLLGIGAIMVGLMSLLVVRTRNSGF